MTLQHSDPAPPPIHSLLPHSLFGFPMTPSQAGENLRKAKHTDFGEAILGSTFRSVYFLHSFSGRRVIFQQWDPQTSPAILCAIFIFPSTREQV